MHELRLPISRELAGELEDFFCEDYQTFWSLEENWKDGSHSLRGFFADPAEAAAQLAVLRERFPALTGEPVLADLPDASWREAYKLHFQPWQDRGLHFVPVWERERYVVPPGEEVIYLDPGMAFGTGNHETTRLCLRRLLDLREDWGPSVAERCVLDAGCGSGILAIAARKLGFGPTKAFDLDPDSVRISVENAELCGVAGQIDFLWAGLDESLEPQAADVLLANILAPVLAQHAEALLGAVRPGGVLILSGILAREAESLARFFAAQAKECWGTAVSPDSRADGEWADLCLHRPR